MEDTLIPNGLPSEWEAEQFVLLILGGMPPMDALAQLVADLSSWDPLAAHELLGKWSNSATVKTEMVKQMGIPWHKMTLEQRMAFSISKHYNEMSYYLFSNNYSTLDGPAKAKADTCRTAIETKLAGNAGKMTPMEEFLKEIKGMKGGFASPKTTFPMAPPLPDEPKMGKA